MYRIGDKVTLNRPFYVLRMGVTIPVGAVGIVKEILEQELLVEFPSYGNTEAKLFSGEVKGVQC